MGEAERSKGTALEQSGANGVQRESWQVTNSLSFQSGPCFIHRSSIYLILKDKSNIGNWVFPEVSRHLGNTQYFEIMDIPTTEISCTSGHSQLPSLEGH